jgi:PIN domain nuclease of toxin-antitoxin system
MSVLELARKAERGKLVLDRATDEWIAGALSYPGVRLVPLAVDIALASVRLPEPFHRDPTDRVIVATSRVLGLPLLTSDRAIRAYKHVTLVESGANGFFAP